MSNVPDENLQEINLFVAGLTREERMLVVVRDELYGGSWAEMRADLEARLEGRPYIFKLAHRIEDDLDRIERMREFEQARGINLGQHIQLMP